jgi:hypothetical protein
MAALGDIARIVAEAAAADAPPQQEGMRALPGLQRMRAKIKHLKAQRKDEVVILRKDLQIAHTNFHGAVRQDDVIRLENPGERAAETSRRCGRGWQFTPRGALRAGFSAPSDTAVSVAKQLSIGTSLPTTSRHVTDVKYCIAQVLRNKIHDAVREVYRQNKNINTQCINTNNKKQ